VPGKALNISGNPKEPEVRINATREQLNNAVTVNNNNIANVINNRHLTHRVFTQYNGIESNISESAGAGTSNGSSTSNSSSQDNP
jgi:hypothetical protein